MNWKEIGAKEVYSKKTLFYKFLYFILISCLGNAAQKMKPLKLQIYQTHHVKSPIMSDDIHSPMEDRLGKNDYHCPKRTKRYFPSSVHFTPPI
jgi:hypothetical protein